MRKMVLILLSMIFILAACSDSNDSAQQSETACGDKILTEATSVEMSTNHGNFTIELDVENAPISASHFAARVDEGFYDGLIFHRVVPGFVIQGGDPEGTGTGSYDCKVTSEAPKDGYSVGDVAWAKRNDEAPGTAGSQFFVLTTSDLDPQYGYIGKVVAGLDVVQQIEQVERDPSDRPLEDVVIVSAELIS